MQQRRLIRARDLTAFREGLVSLATGGRPLEARSRAVLVPTRAAAELFRQRAESRELDRRSALVWPDFLTRSDFYDRLVHALPGHPRLLTRAEREVLIAVAARRTALRPKMGGAPFILRPGLMAAMLDFDDELQRRQGSVRRLARELFRQLKGERGMDRGSESLIHQTGFLGFAFLAYARLVAGSGALDEHLVRRRLLECQPALPYSHLVIAVTDHPADPRGLWPADFDLIGRLRHLEQIDVVVTDGAHDAGFRERIERELPGIIEGRVEAPEVTPVLIRPGHAGDDAVCFQSRDREEELRDVARAIRERASATGGELRESVAIVFQRPLPYLYLAQHVLTEARIPYQAFDALPLASEPYAALLDVVMTAARTGCTREAAVELLRSRLLALEVGGEAVSARDVSQLDLVLTERRAIGGAETFPGEIAAFVRAGGDYKGRLREGALRAAHAAAAVARELAGFTDATHVADRIRTVSRFLRQHERPPAAHDPHRDRHLRARAGVLGTLDALADALARFGQPENADDDATALIRHAIELRTFAPRRGVEGVHLVDAVAARFGAFDHVHVVGLVETDWPERSRRNIFYTTGLLKPLGWPHEHDQARVERAAFADLLGLASRTIRLSSFQLEGDTIVGPSPMTEVARELAHEPAPPARGRRVFDDEVLTVAAADDLSVAPVVAAWLRSRQARPSIATPAYAGTVGALAPQAYRVSRVDQYVNCPFKYFAENVLNLPEEREEAAGMTPLERGNLVHRLFEQFFKAWEDDPGGAITAATLPDAIARFTALTDEALARLPEADRALERTRLLGSLIAPGIADRVFEQEVDAERSIARRMLEADLKGRFVFPQLGGLRQREVDIRGKADRIDVFEDGSIQVVDYKLSRIPDLKTTIQIAVYAHVAGQMLEQQDKRPHPVHAAMYLAFGGDDQFLGELKRSGASAADLVNERVQAFAGIIDRIEAGEFPPAPKRVGDCSWCRYALVCRKEYRAVDSEAEDL